jgi:hypothetical protein
VAVSARLVSLDGVELLRFGRDDPYWLITLDLGFPDVRDSTAGLPGRSGEYDTTTYHGARAVTAELRVRHDQVTARDVLYDQLLGYCAPRYRAWLYISKGGWSEERRLLVRGAQVSSAHTPQTVESLPVQVGWRAPGGVIESANLLEQTLFPVSGDEGGAALPWTFPLTFDPGYVPGSAAVTNAGTTISYPYVDIYGYCADPVLKNLTTGEQIGFVGLTVQAGDFLRLDLAERVALLTNDRGQSRYSLIDFASSSWWGLTPGATDVAFVPVNPGPTCAAIFRWRNTYL